MAPSGLDVLSAYGWTFQLKCFILILVSSAYLWADDLSFRNGCLKRLGWSPGHIRRDQLISFQWEITFIWTNDNPRLCIWNGQSKRVPSILQTTFSNALSLLKVMVFALEFHWSLIQFDNKRASSCYPTGYKLPHESTMTHVQCVKGSFDGETFFTSLCTNSFT